MFLNRKMPEMNLRRDLPKALCGYFSFARRYFISKSNQISNEIRFLKLGFCIAFSVIIFTSEGQQKKLFISGYVKDIKDNSFIPYANIYLKSAKQQGTVSNIEGSFKLLLPDNFAEDTLFISYVGYQTKKKHILKNNVSDSVSIFLTEMPVVLNDVLVLGTTPLTFLKEAAKITSESCVSPAILNAYYREFISKNGFFTKFADAMVDYYVEYRGSKSSKVQVRVAESRAKSVDVEIETKSGGNFDIPQQLDIESLPYFFDAQRKLNFVLEHGDNGDFYDFDLYEVAQDSDEFFKVVFSPKKGIEKLLFEGSFLINKESSVIHSVQYILPDSHKVYAKVYKLPFGFRVQQSAMNIYVQYQAIGDKYHLKFAKVSASLHVFDKKGLDITHAFSNEMLVNAIDYQSPKEFNSSEVWRKKSIVKRGNNYRTKFWEGQQGLMATEAEQKIIESLSNNNLSHE